MSPCNNLNDALGYLARAQANAEAAEEALRNSNADNHYEAWCASETAERALEAAAEEVANERLLHAFGLQGFRTCCSAPAR